jgi:hypothetical protein
MIALCKLQAYIWYSGHTSAKHLEDTSRQPVIMAAPTPPLAALEFSETSAPPSTFYGWLRLPDEVKVEILAHNLDQPDVVDANTHRAVLRRHLEPIIGTQNRKFVSLALEAYSNRNTFKVYIHHKDRYDHVDISHPSLAYGHLIRKMEVDAIGHIFPSGWHTLRHMLVRAFTGWTRILIPSRPLDEELINHWRIPVRPTNLLATSRYD